MISKKTLLLSGILILCALCFGGGVFYGQYQLRSAGFDYEEATAAVNINTADKETLITAAGIGPVTAERIIGSREEEGEFEQIHDLVERRIMGESLLEELSPRITVK